MAQKKGKTGNPHGRPKGKPNKITADLKQWVKMLIENNLTLLESDLQALEPKERWQVVERLLQYVIPKCKDVQEQNLSPIEQFFAERNKRAGG
jgi:uncharacterized protein (UPF0305 family)